MKYIDYQTAITIPSGWITIGKNGIFQLSFSWNNYEKKEPYQFKYRIGLRLGKSFVLALKHMG